MMTEMPACCPACRGTQRPGTTTITSDTGNCVVVVRQVPALVCDQCGEAYIIAPVAAELEKMVVAARGRGTQVAILSGTHLGV